MFRLIGRAWSRPVILLVIAGCIHLAHGQTFTFSPVVLQGQPAPGTGGTFSLFSPSIHLNDSGAVIFWAKISGGNNGFGIFLFSRGEILPIVLEGQIAPGTSGGRFTYFQGWILNNAWDVLFRAGISDGRGPVF